MSGVGSAATTVADRLGNELSGRDSMTARAVGSLGRDVSSELHDLRTEVFDDVTAHSVTLERAISGLSRDVTGAINRLAAAVLLSAAAVALALLWGVAS